MSEAQREVKLVLCGKSWLPTQFISRWFHTQETPKWGVGIRSKLINVNGTQVKLMLWDTSGQERFRSVSPLCYKIADAAVFVFDVTDADSFLKLKDWVAHFSWHNPTAFKILIGNKTNLLDGFKRVVLPEIGAKFAQDHEMLFIETSAATADKLYEAFRVVTDMITSQLVTI